MTDTTVGADLEGSLLQLVAEAETFEDAIAATLRIACEAAGWEYGEAWLPDAGDGNGFAAGASPFEQVRAPVSDGLVAGPAYDPTGRYAAFRGAGGALSCDLGEGLVGRVLESREVEWLDAPVDWDDARHGDRFGRGAPSTPTDLRSAVGVPVVADDGEVLAVLAFFTTGVHGTDRAFVEAVGEVVAKFGRLFGRTRDRDQGARERALLRETLDASPVGILIHDPETGVEMVNETASTLLGVDTATVLNRGVDSPAWDVRDEDGDPIPPDSFPVADAIAGRESVLDRRVVLVRPDGSEVTLSVNAAPLLDAEGAVSRVVLVFSDVTGRAANEAELAEKNRQLESFAAVLSHDVRSPLAVATGFLDLARETGDLAYLEKVENAHEHIEELIDTLLVLARKGEMVGPRSTVDLETVAREAWDLVDTGDATLDVDEVGDVEADPVRLRQLLENLFANAAQHAGPSPRVRLLPLDGQPGFAVEDDGPGIPEERWDDVLRIGHESSGGGVGLGLSIVAAVAEGHGWDVRVGEGDGGGARVEVRTAGPEETPTGVPP